MAPTSLTNLPKQAGIGLKPEYFREILDTQPDIGFFEIHAENYMVPGGPLHHYLTQIRALYPLSIHGVGLSLGGDEDLDQAHLLRLRELLNRYKPESFSEHLAWSTHQGNFYNDLLPLPYSKDRLRKVCAHIDEAQTFLKRSLLLENPSTYIAFSSSEMDEPSFLAEIIRITGCGLLLDVNNLYVTSMNQNLDPLSVLNAMPLKAVGQIHIAGYAEEVDESGARLLIDNHATPVAREVWSLFQTTVGQVGAQPVLLERDNNLPGLDLLIAEANIASQELNRYTSTKNGPGKVAATPSMQPILQ